MEFEHNLSFEDRRKLDALFEHLSGAQETFLGYPCNQEFDYSELFRFLNFSANNVGDPFLGSSTFKMSTHAIELEVLEVFAKLTNAPKDNYWGYVTNGGTEGNMYGLFLARELLPKGMVYFSEDTHYSVPKIMRVLNAPNIMIKSQENGEMDYDDLFETLRIHRNVPPIIFANIGTTMKGAHDDVSKIKSIMRDLAIQDHYIHCDAALSGMILPFKSDPPPFDFSSGSDSISISGHKFIGSPLPMGIVLAKKNNVNQIARSIEYVGILDTTITGSRSAIAPLLIWYAIKRKGIDGFRGLVKECLTKAEYAVEQFNQFGVPAWRNRHSITVVFPRPSDEILKKWQIAPFQEIGHIITMPHVTYEMIDAVVDEIATSNRVAENGGGI